MSTTPSASSEEATIKYVCGIDTGSQSCTGCICRPDKSMVVKSVTFTNAREGWQIWEEKLRQLDVPPNQILIGMEATSCYHENLYHELEQRGYVLRLLHPRQTHQFHERQGLRAKTDRLDARTIARVLLSGEARAGYVPSEQVVTYRELVRLHTHLSDEAAAYQNEIQALVVVLFASRSPGSLLIPADRLPSPCSKLFPAPRPWPRQVLSPSSNCSGHRSQRIMAVRPPRSWWLSPKRVQVVGEQSPDDRSVCAFSAISWSIPKRISHVWMPKLSNSSRVIQESKGCNRYLDLAPRQ